MEKYSPAIYAIIISEFCARFAFCGIRTLLSLYLRNVLLLPEDEAIIVYHVFIMLCFTVPVLGAIAADGCLGRFRTIFFFSVICTFGHVFTYLGATPMAKLNATSWTMIGLSFMAVGAGGVKPCVAAFGGDQFRLPQQQTLLQQFFSLFYFTANLGGLMGMVLTPLLRQMVSCFGNEFCYSLAFGLPAVLAILSVVVFLGGKPCYRIKAPKENIVGTFLCCAAYALMLKVRKRKQEQLSHWLDYAASKYDAKLIRDMKAVLAIFLLFIPLPVFWSLIVQQGSRWTFQATRMNGQLFGLEILPDQIQAISPAMVLFLIPLFNKLIYPRFARCNILVSSLQRMALGGVIAGLAFVCAGILEYELQHSYPPLPPDHEGQIIIINTLPCDLSVEFNEKLIFLPNSQTLTLTNIPVDRETITDFVITSPDSCGNALTGRHHSKVQVALNEKDTKTVLLAVDNSEKLKAYTLAFEDLTKALNGRPKIRLAFLRDGSTNSSSVTIYDQRGSSRFYYVKNTFLGLSNYSELRPGKYSYYVTFTNTLDEEFQGFLVLKPGGVYSLVLREHDNKIMFAQNFALTPPNHIHILWLLPQFVLISVAEVLFAISGIEFCFTQAPKSMKTVTMAAWYFSVACGNFLIIIVTQILKFKSQVIEFFFFTLLLSLDLIFFLWIAHRYKFRGISESEASQTSIDDEDDITYPLLEMPSH